MAISPEQPLAPINTYEPAYYDNALSKLQAFFSTTGGYDYEAWEILPKDSAGILAPKHRGHTDPPLVGVVAHHEYQRPVRFLAGQGLLDSRMGAFYRGAFPKLGVIMLDQSRALDAQPAGQAVEAAMAANDLLDIFIEGGVVRGPILGKTKKIGGLAVRYNAPIQAVGVSGTEADIRQVMSPKYVVLGRVAYPDQDKLHQFDPETDGRLIARYAIELSKEVDRNIQEATTMAERARSTMRVSFSGPKNTPKFRGRP